MAACLQAAMELLESDSDEEFDEMCILLACGVVRNDRHRIPGYCETVVNTYFEMEFKRLFRLSRKTFDELSARFMASAFFPDAVQGRRQISAEKTCLIALVYIGSQSSMYATGDKFDVTESSVHVCVNRVVKFLHGIRDEVICWPGSAEIARVKAGFHRRLLRARTNTRHRELADTCSDVSAA
ncbi:uncharacterized protein [Dermacentor albipictus]|uniref:uncharacterized protein n=1 Tax=Dermacentor albipictus TaxID=60249 RepID=UPI0031FC36CC